MFEQDFKAFLSQNKLLLPEQPNHDDFLQVMEKVFQYSCIFGVFGSKKRVTYVWSTLVLGALICVETMAIWKVIKALFGFAIDIIGHRSVAARFAGTMFYSISIASLILASRLFSAWHSLSAAWAKVERTMTLKVPVDKTLKKRMYFMATFMFSFSMFEHLMSIITTIGFDCPPELILKRYVLLSHGFMILRHEYSEWFALPLFFISAMATLLWTFQDLLIVLVSIGLSSRYRRLNQCLARVCALEKKQMECDKKTESLKLYTWRKLREAYVRQAMLVRKMDVALGGIIILSCMCNFYFICLQLFLVVTQSQTVTPLSRISYFITLSWLCIRVTCVVLTASDINVQSQLALKHIYTYDTHGYNIEVERLQDQLTKDYIALSGKGFFYLNKTILLQMAGAIITYELVLIQFDNKGAENIDNIQLNTTST
ncbi:gustatory receptor for sugar taste 64a-like [Anticarsia gemmatalis]|uniref:gustatory receptor for sugar taste 64a-like n=1 Tax=Anticarsia gemmatalis TaxID=129554 RepID=UPI003F75AD62